MSLALAALAVALGGCRSEPELSGPIQRFVVVADLIGEAAGQSEERIPQPHRAPMLTARTAVPSAAVLHLDGRIRLARSAPRSLIGPVVFEASLDGREIFKRRLYSLRRRASFRVRVPLDGGGEKPRELVLRMTNHDPDRTVAVWHRATLEACLPTRRQPAESGFNLLVLMVDTLRADHCGLYGYGRDTTPSLDRFSRRALVFERAIAPSSWTLPSVASVLTGLGPPQHGSMLGQALNHRLRLLSEVLQASGLTTCAVSANPLVASSHGFDEGIETFVHLPPSARADEVNAAFCSWLDRAQQWRWFAYLHYMDPHDPYDAPGEAGRMWVDPSYRGVFRRPKTLDEVFLTVDFGRPSAHPFGAADLEYLSAAYDGEIRHWDGHFQRLLDVLSERGLLEHTVVVVTADHGEEFAEHGMFKHGHQLYDETTWVPLVIWRPDHPTGQRRGETFAVHRLFDLVLEALDLAEAKPTEREGGPVFAHTTRPVEPDDPTTRTALASVELQGWKLVHDFATQSNELYRLGADPGERVDLAGEERERAVRYHGLLMRWLKTPLQQRRARRLEASTVDDETLESLRRLGYVE